MLSVVRDPSPFGLKPRSWFSWKGMLIKSAIGLASFCAVSASCAWLIAGETARHSTAMKVFSCCDIQVVLFEVLSVTTPWQGSTGQCRPRVAQPVTTRWIRSSETRCQRRECASRGPHQDARYRLHCPEPRYPDSSRHPSRNKRPRSARNQASDCGSHETLSGRADPALAWLLHRLHPYCRRKRGPWRRLQARSSLHPVCNCS